MKARMAPNWQRDAPHPSLMIVHSPADGVANFQTPGGLAISTLNLIQRIIAIIY